MPEPREWDRLIKSTWSLVSNMTFLSPTAERWPISCSMQPRGYSQIPLPSWPTSHSMQPSRSQWGPSDDEVIPSLSLPASVVTCSEMFGSIDWLIDWLIQLSRSNARQAKQRATFLGFHALLYLKVYLSRWLNGLICNPSLLIFMTAQCPSCFPLCPVQETLLRAPVWSCA